MIPPFRLYISSGRDLRPERELIGTAIAEIPIDVGWRINYSPTGNEPLDLEVIGSSDLHFVLMGGDISAPVGLVHYFARRNGRRSTLLLKIGVNRTLAANAFIHFLENSGQWQPFSDRKSLRSIFLKTLTSRMVEMASRFRLTDAEVKKLLTWSAEINDQNGISEGEPGSGAGDSSVILSVERFHPSEGVLLEDTNDSEEENPLSHED
jgi:hypothetical protein